MTLPDLERWRRISPLLDGLLDLPPGPRAERLAALRGHDPALADELAALIGDAARAEAAQFLAGAAAPLADAQSSVAPTLVGARIGAYVLETPLGQGGMGAVWRARRADGRFAGQVAIKLLHLSLISRDGMRRFEREGQVLARLSHPNIARLLDAGVTEGGQPYLVLELVEGARIDHHSDAQRLRVDQRVALFRAVLEAVAHAHRHLVIHRDIKPSNILVGTDGAVKLLDFGIAKLLQRDDDAPLTDLTGGLRGGLTPDYAAPEQLRAEAVTTATDVYALGVLLYQLLTGQHPTAPPHATPADLMRTTLETDPGRLSTAVTAGHGVPSWSVERIATERDTSAPRLKRQLGGDLENIVAKALRKVPAERYPTVDAFNEDLRRWAASEPVSARPDSLGYRTARFVKRHRGKVAAGALTFVAIIAGLVGTITQARRAEQQAERATQAAEVARRERDEAIEQERLQRGSNEFLQLLLRDATGGAPGAVRTQLDRAVALIERTRFEHPIVKVALLRQLAGRYVELGDLERGTSLLRQAIASIEGTPLAAPASTVPISLACSLARNLHEMDDQQAALAEVDRASRLIAAGANPTLPSRVDCDVQRSYIATALGDYAAGVAILRDALRKLASAGVSDGEQSRVVRSALSRALLASGDNGGAMAIARPLLAESIAGQGQESIAVVRRASVVTSLTRLGGDPLAALALSEADRTTVGRLLGAGRVDAALELEHGRILLDLGRFDEAATVLMRSATAAQEAKRTIYVLPAQLGVVEALVRSGRTREAAERFAALQPLREKAAAPEQLDALRVAAALSAAQGDVAAAKDDLDAAARIVEKAGAQPDPRAFAIALAQGQRGLADGRVNAAEFAVAERALALARRAALAPERSGDVGRALLLRAQILAAAGRAGDAQHDAAAARDQLKPTLGATHPDTVTAAAMAGPG